MLIIYLQTHAQLKKPLTAAALQAAIDNIRGAVMICYLQGLPEWDFVRQCLEEREDLTGTNVRVQLDVTMATCHKAHLQQQHKTHMGALLACTVTTWWPLGEAPRMTHMHTTVLGGIKSVLACSHVHVSCNKAP